MVRLGLRASPGLGLCLLCFLLIIFESTFVAALDSISVAGKYFFLSGERFFIKGAVYDPVTKTSAANTDFQYAFDNFTDATQCALDASALKDLGANSISVYYIDIEKDHSGCMAAFADVGIYVWVGLFTPQTEIYMFEPTWNHEQFGNWTKVVDEFSQYGNTAGFFVGRESTYDGGVLDDSDYTLNAPYFKAAARDIKAYQGIQGYRKIPLGYVAYRDLQADADYSLDWQHYLGCGNSSETVDFYAVSVASWCDNETYTSSGYEAFGKLLNTTNIPTFVAETGCVPFDVSGAARTFADQEAIFGANMNKDLSGAVVYNFANDPVASDMGIFAYATTNGPRQPTPAAGGGYSDLKSRWATLTPKGSATSSVSAPACPTFAEGEWSIEAKAALPPTAFGSLASKAVSTRTGYTTSTTATGTSRSTSSTATNGASTSSSSGSNQNHPLPTLTIVGICIGIGIIVLIFIAACVWFCGPRAAAWQQKRAVAKLKKQMQFEKPELDGIPMTGNSHTSSLGELVGRVSAESTHVYEAMGADRRNYGMGPFYELGPPEPSELYDPGPRRSNTER